MRDGSVALCHYCGATQPVDRMELHRGMYRCSECEGIANGRGEEQGPEPDEGEAVDLMDFLHGREGAGQ